MWASGEIPSQLCKSALWDKINGWEVVLAVTVIMSAWSFQRVAQMYFTWRIAVNAHPTDQD